MSDMYTKQQNLDMSDQCVPQTDISIHEPWDTSDMAHRSGGLNVEQAEKQEPKPVGMTCKVWTHGCALFDGIDLPNETLLYTAPPKREWVGLTSEELAQLTIDNAGYPTRLTAAIETKLKEKNDG